MTTFYLVHGAFQGGWCWDLLAEELEGRGHVAFAPTLASARQGDASERGRVSLSDLIDEVVADIEARDLSDVVLVGHSLGGMVVTAVADRCRERVHTLAYLDAFVPRTGEAVKDLVARETYLGALQALHLKSNGRMLPVIFPVSKFVDWAGEKAESFAARLTPQPFLTLVDPVFLRNPPLARRLYLFCTGNSLGLFDKFGDQARNEPSWIYREMATSHDVMLVAPVEVAEALIELAVSAVSALETV
jgi:pimeloyl-ACP methyl ester carboxylesterase